MTEERTDNEPPAGLEEQFKDMLRKANISFIMGQPQAQESGEESPAAEPSQERLSAIAGFSLKPREIRDYLDRFVIRQDEAKKVLSVAICDHYNHVRQCLEDPKRVEAEYAKHNIMLLGPTGVGKTYLMRCIARLIGVPFVKADATKFSETGYVGHDVEDLVRDLVKAGDGDVDLAQYGIIYVDEIDKIASSGSTAGKDVSGRGVQINLLKLMEETDVSLFSQTDLIGQMQAIMDMQRGKDAGTRTINTRHMLFIVSGAFDKLGEQVRTRVGKSPIGFGGESRGDWQECEYLRLAETRDLIDYGFEPEFIGRLPIRVVCDALSAGDLEEIMVKSEGSILDQYRRDFEGYGIDFSITREALGEIARRAHCEKTGARGLMTVLEKLFRDYKFELPSTAIRSFEVDDAAVGDPRTHLTELMKSRASARRTLLENDVKGFADAFYETHGLKLSVGKDAVEAIVDACIEKDIGVPRFCAENLHDLEYGLRLISRNTGRTSFNITRRFVENPEQELSRRIAQSFKKEG